MTALATRQAALADLDVLVPLFDAYRQFYGRISDEAGARAFLHERFTLRESVILLALAGDKAVGFAQLYPGFSSVAMGRLFVLNDWYVSPQGRRQGVGPALLLAAADYAKATGAIRLNLSNAVSNATVQSVYEAAGWVRDTQFFVYQLPL